MRELSGKVGKMGKWENGKVGKVGKWESGENVKKWNIPFL